MNCPRCHGLMMAINMLEMTTSESQSGWRCLLCGEVTDAVIEANRKGHQGSARSGPRLPIVTSV
jgi:hypothetical protein